MTEEEIKRNVSNAKVSKVKQLQFTRDGLKRDSLSIMIQFEEEALPVRVMVGYMSYNVREYVPPPLRCYKCHRFGHVAAVCKSKQRCGIMWRRTPVWRVWRKCEIEVLQLWGRT